MPSPAPPGTKIHLLIYETFGDVVRDEEYQHDILGPYSTRASAQAAGKRYLKKYLEEELAEWSPEIKTKEDRARVEREWDYYEGVDEKGWWRKCSCDQRGLRVRVREWRVRA